MRHPLPNNRRRLGMLIKQRRAELGLSKLRAVQAAGVGRDTWSGAEDATRETDVRSLRKIERVLRWQPGSINAILAGGDPTPEPDYEQQLSQLIEQRRRELGMSTAQAAETVGVSKGVWLGVERGTRMPAEPLYERIEQVLRWQPGSIRSILAGGTPTPESGSQQRHYADPDMQAIWELASIPPEERLMLIETLRAERERQQRRRRAG